jgi:predicted ATP-grasp superfamily ATP-dependent carboligase
MRTVEALIREAGQRPVAFVYPAYTMASYAVIKSLGRRGVPIVAMNPTTHPHMKSRYVAPHFCPSFTENPQAFIRSLKTLAAKVPGKVVLYLMEDVYVYMIHRFRAELPENILFPFMDEEALSMSVDKRPMFDAAERAGLPLPVTYYPETLDELEALKPSIPFPCLMKPLVSRFSLGDGPEAEAVELFPRTFGGKCVRADDYETLHAHFTRARALGIPVCVQELLEGPIKTLVNVHLYADANHEVLGAVTGHKLRQFPADFGSASLCDLVRRDDALEYCRRFVKESRYHGMAGIEFREDLRTGELKLIEINPRGMYGLGMSLLGGVELPYIQYSDLLGAPIRQEQTEFEKRWLDGRGELTYWNTYTGDPQAPFHVNFKEWITPIIGATPAVLNLHDPMPGLMGLIPKQLGAAYLDLKNKMAGKQTPITEA